jgi:hypothetical protein
VLSRGGGIVRYLNLSTLDTILLSNTQRNDSEKQRSRSLWIHQRPWWSPEA